MSWYVTFVKKNYYYSNKIDKYPLVLYYLHMEKRFYMPPYYLTQEISPRYAEFLHSHVVQEIRVENVNGILDSIFNFSTDIFKILAVFSKYCDILKSLACFSRNYQSRMSCHSLTARLCRKEPVVWGCPRYPWGSMSRFPLITMDGLFKS